MSTQTRNGHDADHFEINFFYQNSISVVHFEPQIHLKSRIPEVSTYISNKNAADNIDVNFLNESFISIDHIETRRGNSFIRAVF